jgi:hypothetical protein
MSESEDHLTGSLISGGPLGPLKDFATRSAKRARAFSDSRPFLTKNVLPWIGATINTLL